MSGHPGRVVCLSYLASAELWNVPRFPAANQGAEICAIEQSVAADGPMVAAVLRALGVPSLLVANNVGDDSCGAEVLRWLRRHHVATTAQAGEGLGTPQIVVVADNAGTRTWFAHLPGVAGALERLDLTPLVGAWFAYIDCYELFQVPAVRAIRAARSAGVPLLLNLGGSPLPASVIGSLHGYPGLIVQTNVDDDGAAGAARIASSLLDDTSAAWVIVTAGGQGAFAFSRAERLSVPAFRAEVRHTHCAGAAFSGGLLYGLLQGRPMAESLSLACACGALRCERAQDEPLSALAELQQVIGSRERMPASAVL